MMKPVSRLRDGWEGLAERGQNQGKITDLPVAVLIVECRIKEPPECLGTLGLLTI